jgi:hypothetical protein
MTYKLRKTMTVNSMTWIPIQRKVHLINQIFVSPFSVLTCPSNADMCMMPIRSESNQIKRHENKRSKCARVRITLPRSKECMKSEDE